MRALLARLRTRGRATLAPGVRLAPRVQLDVAPGARLTIAEGATLAEGCRIHVRAGSVHIGACTRLGENCVIAAHERIEIGEDCRLEGGNLLVDFDHVFADPDQPVRVQGISSAPVRVEAGAVLDRGASVLRGATVGAGARVLAHAVVTRDVEPGETAGGVPISGFASPRAPSASAPPPPAS